MTGAAAEPPTLAVACEGTVWRLTDQDVVIGRGSQADIRIEHPQVSRRHAVLSPGANGAWTLRDLGSANGTFVRQSRVTSTDLQVGAVVTLGTGARAPRLTIQAVVHPTVEQLNEPADGRLPAGSSVVPVDRQGRVTIGRASDNRLVIDDLQASRHHAVATRRGAGFWVEDLGSLNGTYINGQPATAAHVGPGDLLTIGRHHFRAFDGELVVSRQPREVSLSAHGLRVVLPDGKQLLGGVDFELPTHSLMAVIGPSGAGKSTLLGALTGARRATSGQVTFDGRDLYANYRELRHRIGLVPQDDVVHPQLTVRQALEYASRLRFPADLDTGARRARIEEVIAELELTPHVGTRIDRLSGGQRKRTSVALELLTEPSLLFLDEPTSGLDPGLDKTVMTTLRSLADGGRTVVVVTHSVANLGLCDRVLLLAPGGSTAYFGPPDGVLTYFGCADYSDVFTFVAAHPDVVAQQYRRHASREAPWQNPAPARVLSPAAAPLRQQSIPRQVATLAARHLRVLVADRSYAMFTALLPLVLALLVLAVPGDGGFGAPGADRPTEKMQLLVVLIVGAAFMGVAASARDLVAERAIFAREKAVGLSAGAYLLAKLGVYLGLALGQSAALLALVLTFADPPQGSVILGNGIVELYAAVSATTFAGSTLGLLISAAASTSEQVMPLMVVFIMAQLVLCGGLIPIADQPGLEQLSWLAPSRWGYAAGAATIDVHAIPGAWRDTLWQSDAPTWLRSIGMLAAFTTLATAATWHRLRAVGTRR